ncbi:PLP-dependent aminotransferase family protein [Agarivorans sp. QJM3NY_33]|uniref:aminotransferase-like domain-containing protein n=1 Tax=Agarivorans sp. QJM3NY_33 TaxID=3421432 RepID=UPI003D7CE7A1
MAKYKQIARQFIDDIEAGKLSAGVKMPSLRRLANQQSISMTTAVSCYQELEALGWLVARPQAGFFVSARSQNLRQPDWQRFTSKVAKPKVQAHRSQVPDGPLGRAQLAIDDSTLQLVNKSLRAAIRQTSALFGDYPARQGEPVLRQVLAGHFTQNGLLLKAEELVITHGCMDAVRRALEVCTQPGDSVAISSPCYDGLLDLLSVLGLQIVELPSLKEGIDLAQLEAHLQQGTVQAGLFCTSHMNPQGITMSVEQKQRLARLAADYKTPMIEDDIYLELSHQTQMPLPASYYDQSGYMLWCGSVSKTLSASLRVGWCRPGRYRQAFIERSFGVSTILQFALADFIDKGDYAKHMKRVRYQLQQQKQHYLAYLTQHLPPSSRITAPDGGLVLWLQIPGLDPQKLIKLAQGAQLDIRVGQLFTASQRYQDCLRLNMGWPLDQNLKQQLDRLMAIMGHSVHC